MDKNSAFTKKNILKALPLALERSPVVVITDIHGNIENVKRKFMELNSYSKKEVIGKNPQAFKYRFC